MGEDGGGVVEALMVAEEEEELACKEGRRAFLCSAKSYIFFSQVVAYC
jgi:hypothetical protein